VVKGDSSAAPLESEYVQYFSDMFKNYHNWPLTIRRIAPFVAPAAFDGRVDHYTPLLGEAGRPGFAMFPGERQNTVEATVASVKMPQIHDAIEMVDDLWAQTIGGKNRESVSLAGMLEKFKQEEEIIGYQGDDKTSLDGLVSTATHDMGTPSAAYGIDSGGDGKLENFIAAVTDAKNYLEALVPGYPIDTVMTGPLYNLAKDTEPVNSQYKSNLELIRNILTFQDGDPMPIALKTNRLQEPKAEVTSTANTILYIPRIPKNAGPAWHLISSGFGMQKRPAQKDFSTRIAIREKFSVKILKGTLIAWQDGISTATS
jgi:hypothetical protein